LSRDGLDQNFLHLAFSSIKNEIILELFEELHKMKSILGQDFIKKLLVLADTSGVPLSYYAYSKYFDNDFYFEILNQVKLLCGEETLKESFLVVDDYSQTLLHELCGAKNFDLLKTMKWVNQEWGKELLVKLILLKDKNDQTIFHRFTASESESISGSQILPILEFLKRNLNFESEFLLNEILFNVDSEGGSVFTNLLYTVESPNFYSNLFEFLKNDLNITRQTLENYLIKAKKNCYDWIGENEEKNVRDEILNFLCARLGAKFLVDKLLLNNVLKDLFECRYSADEIIENLNFVENPNNSGLLKNYVSRTNGKNQTILFGLYDNITEVLEWLGTNFQNDKEFLEKLLLNVDENGNTFLPSVLNRIRWDFEKYFTGICKFLIENFGKIFLQNFLLIENKEGENILNLICNDKEWMIIKILNLLLKEFQNDLSFLQKLINEKLRESNRVKRWMKVKLNIDLFGEGEVFEEGSSLD
jgi:hypothetical protein